MIKKILIGSRASKLALAQSNQIRLLLQLSFPSLDVEIKTIKTQGDKILDKPIHEIGGKSLFTTELDKKLIDHEIDLAVHSLKDLPTSLNNGLKYLGSPYREDVRDTFVSNKWKSFIELPKNSTIATGSIRRRAQILAVRPDLKFSNIRGNLDTRLRKLKENNWDGIILAAAGLHRLNLHSYITEYLDPKIYVPAPGQGALGLEIAKDRRDMEDMLSIIIDKDTTACCIAERIFLHQISQNCSMPIGCYARIENEQFSMVVFLSDLDGKKMKLKTIKGNKIDYKVLPEKLATEIMSL